MNNRIRTGLQKSVSLLALSLAGLAPVAEADSQQTLHIYNWAAYIDEESVPAFEKQTGIKVVYDVFDSNEVLEAKLLSGNSGYDLVVPSSHFLGRQIRAGAFLKLDKNQLPNYRYLDKDLLQSLQSVDPGNDYGVPYMWGTTGVGYNVDKIEEIFGEDAPLDSWALVFEPENLKKLSACGVNFIDSADDIYPLIMAYLGVDPNSTDPADYAEDSVTAKRFRELRPYITSFSSSSYTTALATGEMCVSIGWSGEVLSARYNAQEAGNGVRVEYYIPKDGAPIWFDMMAIPADAENPQAALKFINFILDPHTAARITDYVAFANPNTGAAEFQDPEITNDPAIYPDKKTRDGLFPSKIRPANIDRVLTRTWTKIRAGR